MVWYLKDKHFQWFFYISPQNVTISKNEIKELVGKTKIDDSLKKCERLFNLIGKVNNSELIIIKSRQSKFKSDSVKGILSKEDEGLEYRKIVDLILKLLQLD